MGLIIRLNLNKYFGMGLDIEGKTVGGEDTNIVERLHPIFRLSQVAGGQQEK